MVEKSWSYCTSIRSLKGSKSGGQKPQRLLACAPCAACVEQLSDNRVSVDCLYGVTWQTMTSQNSQSVESLGAVSDYFSDMVGSRQSISECYAQNFESCDSNNALNWERRHCRQSADTCPRSLATWRSLHTFNSTVSVLWYRLYADWWIGIMLWALKKTLQLPLYHPVQQFGQEWLFFCIDSNVSVYKNKWLCNTVDYSARRGWRSRGLGKQSKSLTVAPDRFSCFRKLVVQLWARAHYDGVVIPIQVAVLTVCYYTAVQSNSRRFQWASLLCVILLLTVGQILVVTSSAYNCCKLLIDDSLWNSVKVVSSTLFVDHICRIESIDKDDEC